MTDRPLLEDERDDVYMRLQVITSLQTLAGNQLGSGPDTYAAAARKSLRALQARYPHLFTAED